MLPPFIIFFTILVASLNVHSTVICFLVILPALFLLLSYFKPKLRFTNFYFSWTVSSFILLLGVFEFEVVPYLEILMYENATIVFLSLITVLLTIVVRVKAGLRERGLITDMSPRFFRNNFCSWIKCPINGNNRIYFVASLVTAIAGLVYGSQLMLTTICHPILVFDSILLPDDCSEVYSDTQ